MNQELLLEAIEIIGKHLLYTDFGGTAEGRRLTELLHQLTGKPRSGASSFPPKPRFAIELMTRTLTLPVNLDNAVTVAVEQTGTSRDAFIAAAVGKMLAEKRP